MEAIHILLVEDNIGDIMLTREAFEAIMPSLKLSVVKDGYEAIEFMNKHGPYSEVSPADMILLDINLPRKNGFEVLSYIKASQEFKPIPVIMFSTSSSEADIKRCYENSGTCFITKPFNFNDFHNVIESIINFWIVTVKLPAT